MDSAGGSSLPFLGRDHAIDPFGHEGDRSLQRIGAVHGLLDYEAERDLENLNLRIYWGPSHLGLGIARAYQSTV